MATTRRGALTGAAAFALTAALPAPAAPCETTRLVRSMLLFSIEGMADELAAAAGRGEPPERLTSWYGYGLHLAREELRLFDQGEGAWRDLYRADEPQLDPTTKVCSSHSYHRGFRTEGGY